MPDSYDVWRAYESEKERRLAKLPVCDICGEPIQDGYYYDICDMTICPTCMADHERQI